MTRLSPCMLALAVLAFGGAPDDDRAAAGEWTHAAGGQTRNALADRGPRSLDTIRWTAPPQPDEAYVAHSSPVVAGGRVFVLARRYAGASHVGNRLVALDVASGERDWTADLPPDTLDSWSSPAADVRNQTVLAPGGDRLVALDWATGDEVWSAQLDRPMVNASPLVTADLVSGGAASNRALVTTFDGFGASARLYCINVDPSAPGNPHQPGDVVWYRSLGRASGATPALAGDVVVVAHGPGFVTAIDVLNPPPDPNRPGEPLPIWKRQFQPATPTPNQGFYGGISVAGGRLFASSYEFYGPENSADTYKLTLDGDLVWSIASARTASIPVVVGDQVLLAGGIFGFGSVEKLQQFIDPGPAASPGWDTAHADPPGLTVGGRNHQPAAARGYLYAGTPPAGGQFEPYSDLYIFDLSRDVADPAFVVAHRAGAGGSPALAYGRLFSIGTLGVVAFEPSPACAADVNGSGQVDVADLGLLLSTFGTQRGQPGYDGDADIDLSGAIDIGDLGALLATFGAVCE